MLFSVFCKAIRAPRKTNGTVKKTTMSSNKALVIPRLFFLEKNGSLMEDEYPSGKKNDNPKTITEQLQLRQAI
jgi:hypothetical protein